MLFGYLQFKFAPAFLIGSRYNTAPAFVFSTINKDGFRGKEYYPSHYAHYLLDKEKDMAYFCNPQLLHFKEAVLAIKSNDPTNW